MKNEKVEVSTNVDGTKRSATFNYDFPENLAEATSVLTEDRVFSEFSYAYKNSVQGAARTKLSGLEPNQSDEQYTTEVSEFMNTWKLGDRATRGPRKVTDPLQALLAAFPSYTPEQQMEILRKFQAIGSGATASTNGATSEETPPQEEEKVEPTEASTSGRRVRH